RQLEGVPEDRLPRFHRHVGDGEELITARVRPGGLESDDRKRRLPPGKRGSGRRGPQVALHDFRLTFQQSHHANARPPTNPRVSLFWTARTSLRASRSSRRLAGSIVLRSTKSSGSTPRLSWSTWCSRRTLWKSSNA